jgi:hypothetical protein
MCVRQVLEGESIETCVDLGDESAVIQAQVGRGTLRLRGVDGGKCQVRQVVVSELQA